MDDELVVIDYTNYRGNGTTVLFARSESGSAKQNGILASSGLWMLSTSRRVNRSFALKDVHSWTLPQNGNESH